MSKLLGYLFEVGVFMDDFVIAKGQDVNRFEIMYLTWRKSGGPAILTNSFVPFNSGV